MPPSRALLIAPSYLHMPYAISHVLLIYAVEYNRRGATFVASFASLPCCAAINLLSSFTMLQRFVCVMLVITMAAALVSPHQPRYLPVPGGWMWSTCIHEVEPGSHILDLELAGAVVTHPRDGSSRTLPLCPRPFLRQSANPNPSESPRLSSSTNEQQQQQQSRASATRPANGWQAWTQFNNANNVTFDAFLGFFDVPVAPAKFPGQHFGILYLFTGLQNDAWVPDYSNYSAPPGFDIIQPVLQYGGGSSNGGGEYWGLASWYVTVGAGAVYSKTLRVNTGDAIFGNMTRTGSNSWYIAGVTPNGTATDITVTRNRLVSQAWAFCTLEVYDLASCAYFPPSSSQQHYTQLQLVASGTKVTANWEPLVHPNNLCGSKMTVSSPNTVTLTFQ